LFVVYRYIDPTPVLNLVFDTQNADDDDDADDANDDNDNNNILTYIGLSPVCRGRCCSASW